MRNAVRVRVALERTTVVVSGCSVYTRILARAADMCRVAACGLPCSASHAHRGAHRVLCSLTRVPRPSFLLPAPCAVAEKKEKRLVEEVAAEEAEAPAAEEAPIKKKKKKAAVEEEA